MGARTKRGHVSDVGLPALHKEGLNKLIPLRGDEIA